MSALLSRHFFVGVLYKFAVINIRLFSEHQSIPFDNNALCKSRVHCWQMGYSGVQKINGYELNT